ncbi:hypothetical protein G6Z25_02415 [Clostridium perfringens]|uniref:hypothetical protein n=1 Tax=Clostridium perfringens TaxID=1502 RepID=UPI0013E37B99|nr:hypothetical protein [Clostridium perfringens]NGS95774.1 hypothetical protein [Clostridium perfringens]
MRFNVVLDKEQLEEIANMTADKVLATVEYCKNEKEIYERQIEDYKLAIQQRDSMLVNKDFIIDRLKGRIKELREENKRYESK